MAADRWQVIVRSSDRIFLFSSSGTPSSSTQAWAPKESSVDTPMMSVAASPRRARRSQRDQRWARTAGIGRQARHGAATAMTDARRDVAGLRGSGEAFSGASRTTASTSRTSAVWPWTRRTRRGSGDLPRHRTRSSQERGPERRGAQAEASASISSSPRSRSEAHSSSRSQPPSFVDLVLSRDLGGDARGAAALDQQLEDSPSRLIQAVGTGPSPGSTARSAPRTPGERPARDFDGGAAGIRDHGSLVSRRRDDETQAAAR